MENYMNNKIVNKRLVSICLAFCLFASVFMFDAGNVKAADYSAWSSIFDAAYYYNNCADARSYAGTNVDKLWQFFVKVGIPRGDQASAEFNVFIYAKNYPDLVAAFGGNYMNYYLHYAQSGKKEGRNAKTLLTQTQPQSAAVQATPNTASQAVNSDKENAEYRNAVVELVNKERAAQGLAPLEIDPALDAIAQVRANEIITYFSHTRPNGQKVYPLYAEYGLNYRAAGENIAGGQDTPAYVMDSWMHSTGHRANILNPAFGHIGVGCVYGGPYGIYWVQVFMN